MIKSRLAVLGLGYIGLPTAVVFAQHGWSVTGVDVNQNVVDKINEGSLPFVEEGLQSALKQVVDSKCLHARLQPPDADVYVVAVPTPFKEGHDADLSYIESAAKSIASVMEEGKKHLIVLESTSPVGATEHMAELIISLRPELEDSLLFAHAPERVLPGKIMSELVNNDRIIGGLSPEATEKAKEVYQTFCQGNIYTTDARTAEMTKLTENSFRDVNIAFANELSVICDKLNIDVWELIELANKHPRVNILQPGPGVGGHCIAVDPWFIVSSDPDNSRIISLARTVNDEKPIFVENKIEVAVKKLQARGNTPVLALLGLAFKPDIDDLRESPAVKIAKEVSETHSEIQILLVEPNIAALPESFKHLQNTKLVGLDEALREANIVVQLVNHRQFSDVYGKLDEDVETIDTRGTWRIK